MLVQRLGAPPAARTMGCALDDYIEARIHGPIDLARDIEALVVDPSFEGTETGAHLARSRLGSRAAVRATPP